MYSSSGKTKKWARLSIVDDYWVKNRTITDKKGVTGRLEVSDLNLHRDIRLGTNMTKDTTCDSTFMLTHMHEIGQSGKNSLGR